MIRKDLESIIELDHSQEIYKSYPCEFFQNQKLSAEAVALGSYLHSLPKNWTPRPYQIKKRFGWGKHKWNKACGELRQEGYMFLIGDKDGSRLYFSMDKNEPKTKNKVIPLKKSQITPLSENQTVGTYPQATVRLSAGGFSDCLDNKIIRYKTNNNNVVPSNQDSKETEVMNVVAFEKLVDELIEIGIGAKTAGTWLDKYGPDYIQQKIEMMRNKSNLDSPAAWLSGAVSKNYTEHKQKIHANSGINRAELETQERIRKEDEERSKPRDLNIANTHLKTIKEAVKSSNGSPQRMDNVLAGCLDGVGHKTASRG